MTTFFMHQSRRNDKSKLMLKSETEITDLWIMGWEARMKFWEIPNGNFQKQGYGEYRERGEDWGLKKRCGEG